MKISSREKLKNRKISVTKDMETTMNLAAEIADLARRAGAPEADLTILAEGNAAVLDAEKDRFLVKASGVVMGDATAEDWVWVSLSKAIEILEEAHKKGRSAQLDSALDQILKSAVTPNGEIKKASIETLVHVVAFHLLGSTWSLHTHPTPVVSLAASKRGSEHYSGTVFPDESVICGPKPLFLPYAEPGLALGLGFYTGVLEFREKYGMTPGQVILGNHGLCTFGSGKEEALATTQIAVKAARVRLGALAAGGISFIPDSAAHTIAFRPDEIARRKLLTGDSQ
jgi:rhamnose utilization protein RhaD (predicted bifunctional aldolase and dehydrogenase)